MTAIIMQTTTSSWRAGSHGNAWLGVGLRRGCYPVDIITAHNCDKLLSSPLVLRLNDKLFSFFFGHWNTNIESCLIIYYHRTHPPPPLVVLYCCGIYTIKTQTSTIMRIPRYLGASQNELFIRCYWNELSLGLVLLVRRPFRKLFTLK